MTSCWNILKFIALDMMVGSALCPIPTSDDYVVPSTPEPNRNPVTLILTITLKHSSELKGT